MDQKYDRCIPSKLFNMVSMIDTQPQIYKETYKNTPLLTEMTPDSGKDALEF